MGLSIGQLSKPTWGDVLGVHAAKLRHGAHWIITGYKTVGNLESKDHSLYIELLNTLLKVRQIPVKTVKLAKFPEFVQEISPWFPEEETVNLPTWEKVGKTPHWERKQGHWVQACSQGRKQRALSSLGPGWDTGDRRTQMPALCCVCCSAEHGLCVLSGAPSSIASLSQSQWTATACLFLA